MISIETYCHFTASEIEYVKISTTEGKYPYRVTVHLKSGASCSVDYTDKKDRDAARDSLIRQIEHERRADYESLYNDVRLLLYNMKTINGRQLRIWRQLKDLLGIKIEEEKQ